MARTRGASGAFHMDDGELLDKEGKPIPTAPTRPTLIHMDDGEIVHPSVPQEPVPVAPIACEWLCDRTTWHRNMSGYEAMLLLDMYMGGLTVTLAPEVQAKLPADARQHFRRVVKKLEE